MADEQYRWLDRETAERLLGGEPLEAVDAAARAQVEQLAETLGALSAPPPPTSEELPGEAAALAAFRKVRAERATTLASAGTPAAGPVRDAGVVRLGRRAGRDRRRWGRPARVGLAAVLAAGMLGGVAVAAGAGVFPSPFRTDEPEPAASVSATGTDDPLITPSPDGPGRGDGTDGGSPDGDGTGRDGVDGDGEDASSKEQDLAAERAERIASACRDTRDGKELGADLRRDLEDAAGGASRVREYCEGVLSGGSGGGDGAAEDEEQGGTGSDNGTGPGSGSGSGAGSGPGSGEAGQGGDTDHDPEDSGDAGDPAGTGGRPGRGDQGGRSGATDESGAAGGKGRRTDDAAARAAEPAAPAS